jgi:hypothetical protein
MYKSCYYSASGEIICNSSKQEIEKFENNFQEMSWKNTPYLLGTAEIPLSQSNINPYNYNTTDSALLQYQLPNDGGRAIYMPIFKSQWEQLEGTETEKDVRQLKYCLNNPTNRILCDLPLSNNKYKK